MSVREWPVLRNGSPDEAGMSASRLRRLSARAADWVHQGLTSSLSYLVARNGVIAAQEQVGVSSYLLPNSALSHDAVFALASASKPITATAVMLLVEDGLLSLNRPLVEYLPEICGRNTENILVHQLLTHTSGYTTRTAYPRLRAAFASTSPNATARNQLQQLMESILDLDTETKPGEQHSYCGIVNYLLLGEIVRRVTGNELATFAHEHIFAKLGMQSTSYGLAENLRSRRVVPDPSIYAGISDYDPNDPARLRLPHPGGGVFSTLGDMAIFTQLFLNKGGYGSTELLSPATVAVMTQNQIAGIGTYDDSGRWIREASWGLGWMVQGTSRWRRAHGSLQPVGTFYHQGASGVAIWADPSSKVLGIFLSVISRMSPQTEEFFWEFDRFQNMVMAAVLD